MVRWLAVLPVALLILSGCVSSGGAPSARSVEDDFQAAAVAWQADAQLLTLATVEFRSLDANVTVERGLQAYQEDAEFDGRSDTWFAQYYSESTGTLVNLIWTAGNVTQVGTFTPQVAFPELAQKADKWNVDSPAAAEEFLASAEAQAALNASSALFQSTLDVDVGAWRFTLSTDAYIVTGVVDADSGDVVEVAATETNGLLPLDPPGIAPEPIHKTGTTQAAFDPLPAANGPPCSAPTEACDRTPFVALNDVSIDVKLTWTTDANDYDLFILDESGTIVLSSGASPPGTEESISGDLEAGEYEIVVAAWAVANDSWTLDAAFTA